MSAPLHVFATPDLLGEHLADGILRRIAAARGQSRRFLLGCPTGRTPRPIFDAMARRLAWEPADLSHVTLVLMDEYLVPREGVLHYAPADHPWSCHHFARVEIAGRLNGGLPAPQRIREAQVWFPNPGDPGEYDSRIAGVGGIDFFLLASGAGDGHVAFNPPGSPRDSTTRIIALSDETRRDNLQTFPAFGTLANVPHHGVSVGIATITASREAAMVVWGAAKGKTLSRMLAASWYEADWPATLIHECPKGAILCDTAAQSAASVE